MIGSDTQKRINELQSRRHALLQRREQRGAPVASIDIELTVVRSELQALYALGRGHPANTSFQPVERYG